MFELDINQIQPSQLFLSELKLQSVQKFIDINGFDNLPPIPVKKRNNLIFMTDGHHRAYITHLFGYNKLKVVWEDEELDWYEYDICIKWCMEEDIKSITNLEYRILPHEEFLIKWIKRCHEAFNRESK
ncbi:MAG: hypothetical protein OEY49_14750 [Candidatus Heimdallarchaeota archaeon]|nr:hypothetical protein [Candidatus Heimdallarchaeota archaeon]